MSSRPDSLSPKGLKNSALNDERVSIVLSDRFVMRGVDARRVLLSADDSNAINLMSFTSAREERNLLFEETST
jgi:hypothetical protein